MMVIDRQKLFTTKVIENMRPRDVLAMWKGMEQFAEPTRRIVKQALAMKYVAGVEIPKLA